MENVSEFIINHWILVTIFVVLASMLMSESLNSKISGINPVGTTQAIQMVNQRKGLFLDIREASEYSKEHIADSLSMPLSTLPDNLKTLKDPEQPIILVCASGQRARSAAKQLRVNGFSDVHVLTGGLNSWKEAKLPLFS
ncbi:MAG: rhodanese-like domain-containing protein [Gammaproteobacteria bacterium]|nr:rhodanese-like domain-containing protein [Gammaproteobacteria bacterium]MDH5591478.1 rhodanese-like domain-containing protein [Gammaproteobacteria bacterium]